MRYTNFLIFFFAFHYLYTWLVSKLLQFTQLIHDEHVDCKREGKNKENSWLKLERSLVDFALSSVWANHASKHYIGDGELIHIYPSVEKSEWVQIWLCQK